MVLLLGCGCAAGSIRGPGSRAPDKSCHLRDEGRAALAARRPEDAAAALREALGLWRGRPLADLGNERFARDATAKLDEAWVEALESRIEADLAAGRHAQLVAELRAVAALPALNRGGVPIVSPANSFVGLTRPAAGIDPALPARLYPTGRRNYVRVWPTDDLQGAAMALLARDRGRRRVFVLDDGMAGWGVLFADAFQTAARRLGLTVLGRATWDPGASDYRRLARRIARSGAEAVFLDGLLDSNGARVVKDVRAALDADLLAPDLVTPVPQLVKQAGAAARGVFVTATGLIPQRLPPEGARFVERFGGARYRGRVEQTTVYAAQAASVLLDAIARSDGTRGSVLDELFRTRVDDGLLGTFRFDARGDIHPSPVTVLRVRGRGTSNTILSVDGATVERVLRPPPSLVAG